VPVEVWVEFSIEARCIEEARCWEGVLRMIISGHA